MGLELSYTDGQTLLDEDEKDGLLISTITTRADLDEFEQWNIERAILWTLSRSFKSSTVFSEAFIASVHKHMYGDVWAWAAPFAAPTKT